MVFFFFLHENICCGYSSEAPHWGVTTLPAVALALIYPVFANSVDPDQLTSEEANWSGSALFVIKNVNLYEQRGSSNLIGWKLEVGMAS